MARPNHVGGVDQILRRIRRTLVVPMALWRHDYFTQFITSLHHADPDIRCFWLTATEGTLRQRILASSDEAARPWRLDHVMSGLGAAAGPVLGIEVATEGRTPAEVVDNVHQLLAG